MKTKPIKAVFNYRQVSPEELHSASTNICATLYPNANFAPPNAPAPPVDEATLQQANAELAAAIVAAVEGGKRPIAQLNHQKEVVVKLLKQLVVYVETNCKDDITIFLSSGLTPAALTKTVTPPVSESFRKIEPGANSGETIVTLMKYPSAKSYEVRRALVGSGGVPGDWTFHPIGDTRPPTTISGLTPGATYVFQVRALTKTGYTDWSDSVTRIVI